MSGEANVAADQREYPYFTGEHELFRATIKRFCRNEIAGHAKDWADAHAYPWELFKKAAELGLFGIRIAPEWGGAEMDRWASAAAYDALRYTDFPSLNIGLMVQADLTIPLNRQAGPRRSETRVSQARGAGRAHLRARNQRAGVRLRCGRDAHLRARGGRRAGD